MKKNNKILLKNIVIGVSISIMLFVLLKTNLDSKIIEGVTGIGTAPGGLASYNANGKFASGTSKRDNPLLPESKVTVSGNEVNKGIDSISRKSKNVETIRTQNISTDSLTAGGISTSNQLTGGSSNQRLQSASAETPGMSNNPAESPMGDNISIEDDDFISVEVRITSENKELLKSIRANSIGNGEDKTKAEKVKNKK